MARSATLEVFDPFDVIDEYGLDMPNDVIEFIVSDKWLNRPNLYPRQATLLKVMFLQEELFTQYDYDVIGEWSEGFVLPERPATEFGTGTEVLRYGGDWGIVPDVLERMRYLREVEHRPWFRQTLFVGGRRGSKGHIGALGGAYVLWTYMAMGDPREPFGVDRDKRLSCQVFAGKKEQAKANQWRDLVNVILGGPCFRDYIYTPLSESLTVLAPSDKARMRQMARQGISTEMDVASFEIVPKEATSNAARGPASFMEFFDEGAHMAATNGGMRSMSDVYEAATPSLDQFREYAWIYSGSSPWAMNGKFYELCKQTLEVEVDTRKPVYPENLMIQLASWDIYKDWERTKTAFPIRPAYGYEVRSHVTGEVESVIEAPEIEFVPLRGPIQDYDDAMKRLERANPDTFRVERRAKWATATDAYLPEAHVKRMFAPFYDPASLSEEPVVLSMQTRGVSSVVYMAHGDPGQTGSNFGFAVAHRVDPLPDRVIAVPGLGITEFSNNMPHVVFDYIHAWTPGDFERYEPGSSEPIYEMDYVAIEGEIGTLLDAFMFTDLSFDQWNSIGLIQRLQRRSNTSYRRCSVWERNATAPLNWQTAETFKTALSMGLIHCFAGETEYLTHDGPRSMAETAGTTQRVLDRTGQWVDAEIHSFGVQPLRKVTLTRNQVKKVVYSTAGHRWMVIPEGQRYHEGACNADVVVTDDLQPGQRMAWMKPRSRLARVKPSPYGIAHGIVTGDGALGASGSYVNLWGDKDAQLVRYFPDDCGRSYHTTPNGVKGVRVRNLPRAFKTTLPDLDESPSYLYGWLAGYFAADGSVTDKGQACLTSVRRDLLEHALLVCDRLGIAYHGIREKSLSSEWAASEIQYSIQFVAAHLTESFFLIREHRDRWRGVEARVTLSWRVESVEETDRVEEVFCAVVPGTESFVLTDHLLTMNCPYYELAELECLFLRKLPGDKVDHPDSGPVTTKDVYDAMSICVHKLIGNEIASFMGQELSGLEMRADMPGPNADPLMADIAAQFSAFGQQAGRDPARSGGRFMMPPETTGRPPMSRRPPDRRNNPWDPGRGRR